MITVAKIHFFCERAI